MNPKLTKEQEMEIEWRYRYEERLGLLCGNAEPTDRQKQIAKTEADAAIAALKKASIP